MSGYFSINNTFIRNRITNPLTPEILKAFKEVRNHAVKCFQTRVSEKNIALVLLQLVQALRYEEFEPSGGRVQTGLKEFIIDRCMKNKISFNNVFWYIKLESENDSNDEDVRKYFLDLLEELVEVGEEESPEVAADVKSAVELRRRLIDLSTFLKAHRSKVDEKTIVLRDQV